jgi:hypothetical protein
MSYLWLCAKATKHYSGCTVALTQVYRKHSVLGWRTDIAGLVAKRIALQLNRVVKGENFQLEHPPPLIFRFRYLAPKDTSQLPLRAVPCALVCCRLAPRHGSVPHHSKWAAELQS